MLIHCILLKCSQINFQQELLINLAVTLIGSPEKLDPSGAWNPHSSYWIGDVHVSGETKQDLYQPYFSGAGEINHLDQSNGFSGAEKRTIAPNGSFDMKITPESCEYYNALKDYNITVNHGYLWFSKPIFSEFVSDLSPEAMRVSYPKLDPMHLLCKLIMNSAYGRFAMKPITSRTEFLRRPRDENISPAPEKFIEQNTIEDWDDIDKDNILITYHEKDGVDDGEFSNSIAIASAVAASPESRVYMSIFLRRNNPNFNLFSPTRRERPILTQFS